MVKEQNNSTKFQNLSIGDSHQHTWNVGDGNYESNKIEGKQTYKPLQYQNMDLRSDKCSDTWFYTCDGKKVSTMEDVIQYNDFFYKKMMKNNSEEHRMKF